MPPEWEVKTFTSPVQALQSLHQINPAVILTDQRMPEMNGVEFLEAARKLRPEAIRVIVTGYSDESLVIRSVRSAQISDYIRKPWDPTDLEASLRRAIDSYQSKISLLKRYEELTQREILLSTENKLLISKVDLAEANELKLNQQLKELETWIPPALLDFIDQKSVQSPLFKDLVLVKFEFSDQDESGITQTSQHPLMAHWIRNFCRVVLQHGGWIDSQSGNLSVGYFGLGNSLKNAHQSALAAVIELDALFKGLSQVHHVQTRFKFALHRAPKCSVHLLTQMTQVNLSESPVFHKSIDLYTQELATLSRMLNLLDALPGTNSILSEPFVEGLTQRPQNLIFLGHWSYQRPEQSTGAQTTGLFLLPGGSISDPALEGLRSALTAIPELAK